MFILYGWNHENVTEYGPVLQHKCPNCKKNVNWQLSKISRSFTIFFIPIFSYKNENWYNCSICSSGIKLDDETFNIFKSIAEVNKAYLENTITEKERLKTINEICGNNKSEQTIQKIENQFEFILEEIERKKVEFERKNAIEFEKKRLQYIKDSPKWTSLAEGKSSSELLNILKNSVDYNPALIIAIEKEIEKRKLEN